MPSSMTHYYFAKDAYDKLDRNIKKELNLEKIKLFSQGPDIFYFYNLFIGKKHKYYYDLGQSMHLSNTRNYFFNMLNYINEHKLFNNKDVLSFLYGSLCHYVLDKTIHPFVVYQTGIYKKEDPNTYKYNALHEDMEYYIDIYMIYQNIKRDPSKFKVYDFLYRDQTINKKLLTMIDKINEDTYNYSNTSKYYLRSIKHARYFFRLFNYDPYGIKKSLYILIDKVLPKKYYRTKELSYHYYYKEKKYYLNLDKDEWNHPCNKDEIYNYSYTALYRMAIDELTNMYTIIYNMLEKKEINYDVLNNLFQDVSYLTNKSYKEKPMYYKF